MPVWDGKNDNVLFLPIRGYIIFITCALLLRVSFVFSSRLFIRSSKNFERKVHNERTFTKVRDFDLDSLINFTIDTCNKEHVN